MRKQLCALLLALVAVTTATEQVTAAPRQASLLRRKRNLQQAVSAEEEAPPICNGTPQQPCRELENGDIWYSVHYYAVNDSNRCHTICTEPSILHEYLANPMYGCGNCPETAATTGTSNEDSAMTTTPMVGSTIGNEAYTAPKTTARSCSANPGCQGRKLFGDCCPTPDGTYLSCCSATSINNDNESYLSRYGSVAGYNGNPGPPPKPPSSSLPCTSLPHVQALIDRAILSHTNKGNFQNDNNIYIRLDACNGATLMLDNNQEGVMVRGITGRERITIACGNENSPCYLFGTTANAQNLSGQQYKDHLLDQQLQEPKGNHHPPTATKNTKMRGLFSVQKAESFTFKNIALDGGRGALDLANSESNKKNFATAASTSKISADAWDRPLLHVRGVPDVSVSGSFFLHGQSARDGDDGGGLIIEQGRHVSIRDSRFVGNTATRDGGGLYVDIINNENGYRRRLPVENPNNNMDTDDDDSNDEQPEQEWNSSVTLEALTFTDCHAGRYGGGAYINGADALTLGNSGLDDEDEDSGSVWFERCTAEQGGGGWFANDISQTTSLHSRCNDCDIVGSSSDDYNNNCGGGCAFVRIRCLNSPYLPPCGGCESNLTLLSLHTVNAITGPQALRAAPVSVMQGDDANNGYCGGSDTPPISTSTTTRLPPVFLDYKSSTGRSPVALDPQTEYYRLNIQDSLWCALTNY